MWVFYILSKELYIVTRALHCVHRALHSVKRDLYCAKRALRSVTRALNSVNFCLSVTSTWWQEIRITRARQSNIRDSYARNFNCCTPSSDKNPRSAWCGWGMDIASRDVDTLQSCLCVHKYMIQHSWTGVSVRICPIRYCVHVVHNVWREYRALYDTGWT